jgi:hypothetical protein
VTFETLYGTRIVVSPLVRDRRRFELDPRLREIIAYGRPEYLEQFDDWSARFFGIEYVFLRTLMDGPGEAILCSEAGYRKLRRTFTMETMWNPSST